MTPRQPIGEQVSTFSESGANFGRHFVWEMREDLCLHVASHCERLFLCIFVAVKSVNDRQNQAQRRIRKTATWIWLEGTGAALIEKLIAGRKKGEYGA